MVLLVVQELLSFDTCRKEKIMWNRIPEQIKLVAASYARVFVASSLTLYLAGERDLSALWAAGVAAVLPPLVRWLNPKDAAYGRVEW